MDILYDSLKVLGRIVTILPLMLVIGLYMGRRSIGELPVFDILVILVLGTVVGADIADPKIGHIHTAVAVIAIALLQKGIIHLKLRYRRFGRLATFEPTIVVYKGEFLTGNLKKIDYSIDNLLQMLREKDVFKLADVEIAIVEANGRLSVNLVPDKVPVTPGEMGITAASSDYEIPIILDGEIRSEILEKLNKSKAWVREQLAARQIADESAVFYAGVNMNGDLNLTLRKQPPPDVPPIYH
jgi:uncharacterized membrane protein YcaP (DUF421 family)